MDFTVPGTPHETHLVVMKRMKHIDIGSYYGEPPVPPFIYTNTIAGSLHLFTQARHPRG